MGVFLINLKMHIVRHLLGTMGGSTSGPWSLPLCGEPLRHNAWVLATTLKIVVNATSLLNRKLKPGVNGFEHKEPNNN
jgi:hypothetical protein